MYRSMKNAYNGVRPHARDYSTFDYDILDVKSLEEFAGMF